MPPPLPPPGPAPLPTPGTTWYSLRGLTTALTVLMSAAVLLGIAGVIVFLNRVSVANDIVDGTGDAGIVGRADDADSYVSAVFFIWIALLIAIGVLTIIWTWRAMHNNEVLGRDNARFTPGWGIAGWLIPCANLVIPVLIFQDLWRGSDSSTQRFDPGWRANKGSALVGWWWAAYLLSAFRFGFGREETKDIEDLKDLRTADTVAAIGMGFSVIAAVLFVLVLRSIADRQEACLRAQQSAT
jgi:hypothetical protein